jgi:tetratricopeptide (TPR) repeat protein/predicted Ser/Thr protein kinase
MAANSRVFAMLEEMLDSGKSPAEVCRDCPELLPEVQERWQEFCRIDAEVGACLPEPGTQPQTGGTTAGRCPEGLPQIPGYEVEAMLGRGGMGVVYKARHVALNRTVALKMLLGGVYSSGHERARFQREAESVAGLRHGNIVQVYDVGNHDGWPFFTMEFIEGGTLAEKLAGVPLPARQAAALAVPLAEAVQMAHQAGVIHRDLKPANVLLTPDATPKITDFGLARRLEGGGFTQTGVAVGTPSYMAPEQARGHRRLIGPAVDVYGLGAILYELLTGRPPFQAETAAETLRQVVSQDPVAPSRLNPKTPRDLETICLKCLHKEPKRRYGSAAALADDLCRFLEGRPIQARRLGVAARLGRWCRRNPAATAICVLLVTGSAISIWQAVRATRAETAARSAEQQAQKRLMQMEKVDSLLASIFQNLDPNEIARADRPLQAILVEKLDRAVTELEGESIGDAMVMANMQEKLGVSLVGLGAPGKAIVVLERAVGTYQAMLGLEDPQTLVTMSELAAAYRLAREPERARTLLEKTLKLMQARLGPDDPETIACMSDLALMYQEAGRLDLALPMQEETLKLRKARLGPDHPDTMISMSNLALTIEILGMTDRARPLLEEALKVRKAKLGPGHPQTLISMNNLAENYADAGKLDKALALHEETLRLRKSSLGPDHPDTLVSVKNLAALHNMATAQERYQAKLGKLGPDDIETLLARRDLAQLYLKTNRLNDAELILVKVIDKMKTRPNDDPIRVFTVGLLQKCLTKRQGTMPDSWLTFQSRSLVGEALLGQKKFADAEPLLRTGYEGMRKREARIPAQEKARLSEAAERLARLYEATNKKDEAVKWRKELETLRTAAKESKP